MLADMGTKALSGKRMEELRALWKLEGLEKKDQLGDQGRDFVQEEMTMKKLPEQDQSGPCEGAGEVRGQEDVW